MRLAKDARMGTQTVADAEIGLQRYGKKAVMVSGAEVYLSRILGSYGMAMALVEACHHADFRSLMRVSQADYTISRILDHDVSFHFNCKPTVRAAIGSRLATNLSYTTATLTTTGGGSPRPGCAAATSSDWMALVEQRQKKGLAIDADSEGAQNVVAGGGWRCLECVKCMKREDAERAMARYWDKYMDEI
ncbi:hypothetical protein BDZ91DRAFT_802564 [Kalaharituber pfeilii]|nr:hypothetical protein BDZ91DRAFT_802564 [Kalaharituber pfeilii]